MPDSRRLRCVALGGGTGLPGVLLGLRTALGLGAVSGEEARECLTGIVTVTDDGGSSGRLRRQMGILPPGDVRNCLAALAPDDSPLTPLLQHRFSGDSELTGHPVGNLLLAALTQMTGDFQEAVGTLAGLMRLQGSVFPSTAEDVTLRAEFHGGEILNGETAIAGRHARIKRISLDRPVRPLPETVRALINADVIVVGPGSLYTSILPNLLVSGIASTLGGVRAVRIYVANLMTEPGETDGYTVEDHLTAIRAHVGFNLFDYVLVNRRAVDSTVVEKYAQRGSRLVTPDRWSGSGADVAIVERDLASREEQGKIRHAPVPLARAILELAHAGRPAACAQVAVAASLESAARESARQ